MTPTCCSKDSVIENWALNKKFFVCTECHKEVTPDMPEVTAKKTVWTTYPVKPMPISVEEVEQLELFDNWMDTLSYNPKKDPNGKKE